MPRLLLLMLIFLSGESAAVACSCVRPPTDPAQQRLNARAAARGALALVEVELVAPYDERSGRGERLRVRRTLAGRAPALFEVERQNRPSSAACDVEFRRGARTLILLYAPTLRAGTLRYGISTTCTGYMMAGAAFRAELIAQIRRRR